MQRNFEENQRPVSGSTPVYGGDPGQQPQLFPNQPQQRPAPQQMTTEERMLVKECQNDAYFQRCLPFSVVLGGLAMYGVRTGYLTGSPRFGATPKVLLGITIGYFAGKFSYINACKEKFLTRLPNSNISIAIRRGRGEEVLFDESQVQPQPEVPYVFEQAPESAMGSSGVEKSGDRKYTSYDDLREQHRRKLGINDVIESRSQQMEEPRQFRSNRQGLQATHSGQPGSLMSMDEGWTREAPSLESSKTKRTNKYGDEGFE